MTKRPWIWILMVILIASVVPATVFAAPLSGTALKKTAPVQPEQAAEPDSAGGYTVSVTGSSHGYTELLTDSCAAAGAEVCFVANPDEGYLATVYVGGISPDALVYAGYDLWFFRMPAGNVVIEVAYDKVPGEAHEIRVFEGLGGTYTIDRSSARLNESVCLAVRPDDPEGFRCDIHVFAVGGELHLIRENKGTYYYELFMPEGDVDIFVEYKKSGPYTVTPEIRGGEGGTVTLDRDQAWFADQVTATVIPDPGYEIYSVQAVSHDRTLVSEMNWAGDQCSFAMHPGDTTLEVRFTRRFYPVFLSAGQGGAACADRNRARMGDTVTVVCQPDGGFEVESITGVDNVTDLGDHCYAFVMPAAGVDLQVNFKPIVYPVSVVMETAAGGIVTADAADAMPGETVTLTAFLEEGYRVAKLTGAACTDNGDGTCSFTMPDHPVEIRAWVLRLGNPFLDVWEPSFCYEPVMWAVERGITNGLSADCFGPGESCTRGQVVTFLWRAMGMPEPGVTNHPFADLDETEYYYKAILWAVEHGITSGMSADAFGPGEPCTRGQVVTFLWRAMGKPEPTVTEHPFTDLIQGGYCYDAVLWAVEQGITNGTGNDTFSPDAACTRGQVATFLWRTDRISNGTGAP